MMAIIYVRLGQQFDGVLVFSVFRSNQNIRVCVCSLQFEARKSRILWMYETFDIESISRFVIGTWKFIDFDYCEVGIYMCVKVSYEWTRVFVRAFVYTNFIIEG